MVYDANELNPWLNQGFNKPDNLAGCTQANTAVRGKQNKKKNKQNNLIKKENTYFRRDGKFQ